MESRNQIRQGDVLLIPVDAPAGSPVRAVDATGNPLQGLEVLGERTGHAHRLPARVYDSSRGRMLLLERPEVLAHEEHRHVTVPAGWWQVQLQREYVPASRPSPRSDVD
jgi:hypothetical protein